MIRVEKSATPPVRLAAGAPLVTSFNEAVIANLQTALAGQQDLFDANIYAHASVKAALMAAQHNKCCYCEKSQSDEYAAVEHFRPKACSQQVEQSTRLYPGYYWLTFEWSNLYGSCARCNNAKRNLFPLRDPERRARRPNDLLSDEQAMLIDPGGADDPRQHIYFEDNVAKGKTDEGRRTVEVIKLDREDLNSERRDEWKMLILLVNILSSEDQSDDVRRDCRMELARRIRPDARFSAMARDYLEAHGVLDQLRV